MAACTWTTLTGAASAAGSIKRWVTDDSLDPEEIIAEAEEWLRDRLRLNRGMKTRASVALAEGDSSIDLSTLDRGWLDPIQVWVDGYGEIDNTPDFDLDMLRAADSDGTLADGLPTFYTVIDQTMYFDTQADQDYSLHLTYYGEVPALSSTNLTNLWVERYRRLFKYVAMAHAYLFLKDETRAATCLTAAEKEVARIESDDDLGLRGLVTYTKVV